MSGFDYLSLIKRQAKALSKEKSIKLSAAQALIASRGGFKHYHELQKVASKNPDDIRLMRLALQTDDLKEVVYGEDLYDQIDRMLEDKLSTYMAETNADGFCIDTLTVEKVAYDQSSGVLALVASVIYAGNQKPDQPYSGTTLYLDVVIRLFRLVNHWEILDTEDGFQIIKAESDQERDWEQQQLDTGLFTDHAELAASAVKATDHLFGDRAGLASAIETADLYKDHTGLVASAAKATDHLFDDRAGLASAIETVDLYKDYLRLTSAIENSQKWWSK